MEPTASYLNLFQRSYASQSVANFFKGTSIFQRMVGVTEPSFAHELFISLISDTRLAPLIPTFANNNIGSGSFINTASGSISCDTLRFASSVKYMLDAWCTSYSCSNSLIISGGFTHSIQTCITNSTSLTGSVYEIGASYGGLAHCILTYNTGGGIISYTLFDYPEVSQFAIKYLDILGYPSGAGLFVTSSVGPADTAISEYAWSEMDSASMASIYDTYIKTATRAFIRFNHPDVSTASVWQQRFRNDFATMTVIQEPLWRSPNQIWICQK